MLIQDLIDVEYYIYGDLMMRVAHIKTVIAKSTQPNDSILLAKLEQAEQAVIDQLLLVQDLMKERDNR